MSRSRIFLGAVPFIVFGVLFYCIYFLSPEKSKMLIPLQAQEGKIELPDNADEHLFALEGEFRFTPERFDAPLNNETASFAVIPGSFSKTALKNEFGYGSYGLILSNLNPDTIYGLHIGRASSSCTVVVNGQTLIHQGKPGTKNKEEIPGIKTSQTAFYANPDGTAEIIINVSNFTNRRGGFNTPFTFGKIEYIQKRFGYDLILNAIIFAVTFSIAGFFFALGISYKRFLFMLWFAAACLTMGLRHCLFYPHIGCFIFPSIDDRLHFIIRYSTFPLLIIFFTVFVKKTLEFCYKIPYIAVIAVSALYTLSTIVLPPYVSSRILIVYQIISLFCIANTVVIASVSLKKKHVYSLWIFIAVSILAVFGIYDILIALGLIYKRLSIQTGALISSVIISLMVLNSYANSIKEVEILNKEITNVNKSLIRFFPEKIIELLHKNSIIDIELGDFAELSMPILSADIRSFTHISEQLSSDSVFNLLNEYFALVAPIVRTYGGIIPKYLGDGFYALFPQGADAAICCAIEIQRELNRQKISPKNGEPIKIGIGIDFNDILLGTVGDKSRMDCIIISNAYRMSELLQRQTKIYGSAVTISNRFFLSLKNPMFYNIRPVRKMKTLSGQPNFLFEVYDSDHAEIRELKHRTQNYVEQLLYAVATRRMDTAKIYINTILNIFPEDRVTLWYKEVVEHYTGDTKPGLPFRSSNGSPRSFN